MTDCSSPEHALQHRAPDWPRQAFSDLQLSLGFSQARRRVKREDR